MELKDRIMQVMDSNWKSTLVIAKAVGTNWYSAKNALVELERVGMVEMFKSGRTSNWRKKSVI